MTLHTCRWINIHCGNAPNILDLNGINDSFHNKNNYTVRVNGSKLNYYDMTIKDGASVENQMSLLASDNNISTYSMKTVKAGPNVTITPDAGDNNCLIIDSSNSLSVQNYDGATEGEQIFNVQGDKLSLVRVKGSANVSVSETGGVMTVGLTLPKEAETVDPIPGGQVFVSTNGTLKMKETESMQFGNTEEVEYLPKADFGNELASRLTMGRNGLEIVPPKFKYEFDFDGKTTDGNVPSTGTDTNVNAATSGNVDIDTKVLYDGWSISVPKHREQGNVTFNPPELTDFHIIYVWKQGDNYNLDNDRFNSNIVFQGKEGDSVYDFFRVGSFGSNEFSVYDEAMARPGKKDEAGNDQPGWVYTSATLVFRDSEGQGLKPYEIKYSGNIFILDLCVKGKDGSKVVSADLHYYDNNGTWKQLRATRPGLEGTLRSRQLFDTFGDDLYVWPLYESELTLSQIYTTGVQ